MHAGAVSFHCAYRAACSVCSVDEVHLAAYVFCTRGQFQEHAMSMQWIGPCHVPYSASCYTALFISKLECAANSAAQSRPLQGAAAGSTALVPHWRASFGAAAVRDMAGCPAVVLAAT
jgi:hypothetical protein